MTPRYRTIILDVDSTLAALEGIDWLAAQRGPDVVARVAALTDRAMQGEIALESVYGERLALVRPGRAELAALADAYVGAVVPGAADAIARLRAAGVRVALVSGGIRQSIIPLARSLGLAPQDVHAVDVVVDMGGQYFAFDAGSPLATQSGKRDVATALLTDGGLPRPALAVGDGATDLAMRPAVDAFAAFTGVVRREPVVRGADLEIASFDQLLETVLA
ncbi:HAD-superfamily hydrolase, subfamily IB (PSPase-like) [Gemmatirosa kalamazoonensis]|uniref:phosphoserine phosphatase n=1 Tax=Gemmatirosa kalamazoonensis TaxID=861299 RepID=W0REK9_9BACT|nr:HAD-IB family phosphatase [Gemmatirosa kalamazoonensis]AHG89216.1 HAD-superfamily hydrolase, subfamily IB (PSPase-like) [Gemmatirosa kalamazoonensis]